MSRTERRGLMLVLSSPSGAGKTTLSRRLLAGDPRFTMSVSVTTRGKRPAEADGVDYHFISSGEFDRLVADGALIEWAEVFGSRYGTPRAPVAAALDAGRDVLFDIDWQGTRQIRERAGEDLASVFILPPSVAALHQRLLARDQDGPDVVAGRMAKASGEIEHWQEYDYVLVNDDIDACMASLKGIVEAERHRRTRRQRALAGLVETLRRDLDAFAAPKNGR